MFPYVVGPLNNKSNPYRAKFRIHKGLPGYSGRDICLGNYEDDATAAVAVEIFVALYCMEYPQVLPEMCPLFTSCKATSISDIVQEYPIVANDNEVKY